MSKAAVSDSTLVHLAPSRTVRRAPIGRRSLRNRFPVRSLQRNAPAAVPDRGTDQGSATGIAGALCASLTGAAIGASKRNFTTHDHQ
jgi:hypothetical protein